ncbi:biotin--[acetyl-CoA-carboxylase] ligase [Oxalobacter sp. OttesenSCG-928-P03]|nr:biotin--[acetyl-CoA-carboxylase] ligase [Oxalobacter sp. OttesenSCG-928-P03]
MSNASFSSRFLSVSLPEKPVEGGCFVLAEGLGEHAAPFSPDVLFGTNALLGPDIPSSEDAARAFFNVPAPVYFCDEVTSTFAVGHALAQKGALPAWGAVLAACQTAGRGQLGRQWQSPRGNLYVTFRLPDEPLFHSDAAALVTGILLAAAFERLGYPLRLKWPNDLLNPDQAKAAGILLENRNGILLAGVGVNLHILPDAQQLRREYAAPAGLLQASDRSPSPFSPFSLWQVLVKKVISVYSHSFARSAINMLPDLADPLLAWKGEAVTVSDTNGTTLSGWLRGVSPTGGLLLQASDGRVHELFSGSLARA